MAAKTNISRYKVISNYAADRETLLSYVVETTVYDFFVWLHHFGANEVGKHGKN